MWDNPAHVRRMCAWARPLPACLLLVAFLYLPPAGAEPWVEVGDRPLRSDIEILAARGLIDGPITTWPIPAGQFEKLSSDTALQDQPEYVQQAARRVLRRLLGEGQPQGLVPQARLGATNDPDTVRDFGYLAREKFNALAGLLYDSDHFSAALRVSDEPRIDDSDTQVGLDGSYLSVLLGNWQLYGGWVDQWYGPGWISSLTLSNNARPVPKIGLIRNNPHAFEDWWLSWLGPWRFDTFVGVLDGPRIDTNTLLAGGRFSFEPWRNTEIGVSRLSQVCGAHHPCNPLREEFHLQNTDAHPSPVADQGTVDLRYTAAWGSLQISPYTQIMNRDNGPFVHSNTTYLVGSTLAGPFGRDGAQWRVVAEYTDTIPTLNWFGFGKLDYGAAYNDYKYVDGKRYRGRTLGFSLDSDSRLFSLAGLLTDAGGWTYRLVYYRANINSEQLAGEQPIVYPDQFYGGTNPVSAKPAQFDQVEAGLTIPLDLWTFYYSVRAQDGQPYPETGGKLSGEVGLSFRF
jgi:hypothetical protein